MCVRIGPDKRAYVRRFTLTVGPGPTFGVGIENACPPLANNAVVFCMSSDPKPKKAIRYFDRESAVVQPDARRPDRIELLELKRRMSRVLFRSANDLLAAC